MRTVTDTYTAYTFDELTDKAKDVAREWFREVYQWEDWYDCVYEDAKNIGLKIKEFDVDRGAYVKASFLASAEETAHKIEKEHGESCETFKDAKEYLKQRDEIVDTAPKTQDGEFENEYELDQKLDDLDSEFLKTLQEDYRSMLQKEWDWINSNEIIDENIRINEYEFLENGKIAYEDLTAELVREVKSMLFYIDTFSEESKRNFRAGGNGSAIEALIRRAEGL